MQHRGMKLRHITLVATVGVSLLAASFLAPNAAQAAPKTAKATLTSKSVTLAAGKNKTKISGKVTPFKAGTKASLQRKKGSAWATIATTTVSEKGTFKHATNTVANGTSAAFRFVIAKTKTTKKAVTGRETVTVRKAGKAASTNVCSTAATEWNIDTSQDGGTFTQSGGEFHMCVNLLAGYKADVSYTGRNSTTTQLLGGTSYYDISAFQTA